MNAPDKVFLSVIPDFPGQYNGIYEEWSLAPISEAENMEYIRKDALLEWAREQFEVYGRITEQGGADIDFGRMNAFSMMINKLASM